MVSTNPLIVFEDVRIAFPDSVLHEHLSFTIDRGEHLLFTGPSGCGKTSIFRALLGFLSIQGRLQIEGKPHEPATVWQFRQRCAYVSQELQMGRGSVGDWLKNQAPSHVAAKLEELLSRLELPLSSCTETSLEQLSRGERQRLGVAVALAREADVLLLDEPTAALDAKLKERVIDLFTAREDATLLVIAHDPEWRNRPGFRELQIGSR